MAIVTTDDKYYKEIADRIREYGLHAPNKTFKPSEMKSGIGQVYLKGYTDGGKGFWNTFQNNGGEMNYYYAFAYGRFTNANYNPKYDIVCSTGATTSSQYIFNAASEITDTKVAIYANGRQASAMFYGCSALKTITKLVVHEDLTYSNTFSGCSALEKIVIEGTIGKAIDFAPCKKLNRTSIESIISALSDSTSNIEARFSTEAVNKAFETSEGANDGSNSNDWWLLLAGVANWAISLV